MKTYKNLYPAIYSLDNLYTAYKKAKKGKSKKEYVIEFEKKLETNLLKLNKELKDQTYSPRPLKIFIVRDPKTRKISKSAFRDRVVHHALCNIIEPIFEGAFIYDSCANRKNKGNLFALKRFDNFVRKVSRNEKINGWFNNNQVRGYCLKADIKHYFETVDHGALIKILRRKIRDHQVISLIKRVLQNFNSKTNGKGMPLGNLTSQFFANVYLNQLDKFVKHKLKAKYYIRYVDDFVILHPSKSQLEIWKKEIDNFLEYDLKIQLHPEKSRVLSLSKGVDFVGSRNFYHYKLLRKTNLRKFQRNFYRKISLFKNGDLESRALISSLNGWFGYAMWANTYKLRKKISIKLTGY